MGLGGLGNHGGGLGGPMMTQGNPEYGPADVTCPYCSEEFHVEAGPTKLAEVTHCNDRWIIVDLEAGASGHTKRFATDGGNEAKQKEAPDPVVGEIRALNGLSWTPWVIITRVEPDSDANMCARFAVLDDMDDDVLTPVPDGLVVGIEQTIADRAGRQELAKVIDDDLDVDKRWCPVDRLDVLGGPGIQGCDY